MRIFLTGHAGYIGSVMVPMIVEAGHEVVGLDAELFADCTFGSLTDVAFEGHRGDVRDVVASDLEDVDAVVHLAALSNDPLGDLDPELTLDINFRASVDLARHARDAGVKRFVFASSCSLYGAQGDGMLDESADFAPITPYGRSKILSEQEIGGLATDDFSPVFMRNATAYGVSPRLRADVVVNNLVGYAVTTGEVVILSDGTPWRPLVHVQDFSRAFIAALEAPRETVHNEAFNVGRTSENYQVRELAEMVGAAVEGSEVRISKDGGPDPRSYRVDCTKAETRLPGYEPTWTVVRGIEELRDAYLREGLTEEAFLGERYFRIRRIRSLLQSGALNDDLRWVAAERIGS